VNIGTVSRNTAGHFALRRPDAKENPDRGWHATEAIKLALCCVHCSDRGNVTVEVCVTRQHSELLDSVLELFRIRPDSIWLS